MAIENEGGQMFSLQEEREWLSQDFQNYSEWSWQLRERFCGSGESSLAPNTYLKSFVSCGGRDRIFQEFQSHPNQGTAEAAPT
jgi:hypothetical protein